MKILVVDDELMIRSLAEKILSKAGFEVVTADSGDEGIRRLTADPDQIRLVLMDWTMPGMTGVETLKHVREIARNVPCIISSGHVLEKGALPEGLEQNTYFLEKPYRSRRLLDKVNRILDDIE